MKPPRVRAGRLQPIAPNQLSRAQNEAPGRGQFADNLYTFGWLDVLGDF